MLYIICDHHHFIDLNKSSRNRVVSTTLKEGFENNGLSLNAIKTKALVFERNQERMDCKISLNGKMGWGNGKYAQ